MKLFVKKGRVFSAVVAFVLIFSLAGCFNNGDEFENIIFVDINHIINPNSGMPYSVFYNEESGRYENTTDHIVSATILSASSFEGETFSTAVCVMGVEKATEFIESRITEGRINSAILFTADKKMLVFGDVAGYNQGGKYSGYLEYELVYGELSDSLYMEKAAIPKGSYSKYVEYVFNQNMEFEIFIYGENVGIKNQIKEELMLRIEELDNAINMTIEDSDIARLNKADAFERLEIGRDTHQLLVASQNAYIETEAAFNVAVPPLSRLWNVDIEGIAKYKAVGSKKTWTYPDSLPSIAEIAEAKALTDLNNLVLEVEDGKYYATKNVADMQFDLGGIAKGYAVDICADILREHNVDSAQLNISGNIYELGNYFDTSSKEMSVWKIGINSPKDKHDLIKGIICAIQVEGNLSIVTSGDYERFYSFGYEVVAK